ncbi:helix-turn-helix transcriptional regulator [Anaerotardibacter muris]|uniref:helix-turn-helix transcriptional regulator n=1 Tax=Anaerotardibacter muris TaxID=2941505 RepID=UPI00204120B5|nr:helix-turn-helix transcriptional regulator [Anaerotardibacter muris]
MSFRDNLIHLRATHNMTQEQLAMMLGVSRQAVTKWESDRSYPEMDKLIKMCQIFDCTLDELVQGDLTGRQAPQASPSNPSTPPADVFDYDKTMRTFGLKIAFGVAAFIMGTALAMPFLSEDGPTLAPILGITDNVAAALGTFIILLGIAAGLALIIPASLARAQFVRAHPFIEDFYTSEDKTKARASFAYQLVGGILCIFVGVSLVILFGSYETSTLGVTLMLACVSIGVAFIVNGSMTLGRINIENYNRSAAEDMEEAEFEAAPIAEEHKGRLRRTRTTDKRIGAICGTIMILATAIALLLLFVPFANGTVDSYSSGLVAFFWLPWPIGGLLCGIVALLMKAFEPKE